MKKITTILLFLILCFISVPVRNNVVLIEVNNPYSMKVRLQVKCDYDRDLEMFRFNKTVVVRAKKNTTIAVPNNLKRCQIWPKLMW